MKTAGIYKIQRIGTDQCYVGSSANVAKRWSAHRRNLRGGQHQNKHLQNAWNLDGEAGFTFVLIEAVACEGEDLRRELIRCEQAWIDKLTPAFNLRLVAESNLGYRHSPETIAKFVGRRHTETAKAKIAEAGRGRKRSTEAIEKTKAARVGYKHSPQTRAKMSASQIGKKRSPEAVEKQRQFMLTFQHSPEEVERMRLRRHTPESLAKMSAAQKGRTHTQDAREKNRAAHIGKVMSDETRARMRASFTDERRARMAEARRGRKMSPEQREKIRVGMLAHKSAKRAVQEAQS